MYQIGELIIYGTDGVCRVEAIGAPQVGSAQKDKLYYTLAPIYRTGKIFTPVEGKVFTRPVLTAAEAEGLMAFWRTAAVEVFDTKNLRLLTEHYQSRLASHDCRELVLLIKSVHLKREQLTLAGKKLGQIDERYLKRAEELLYGELAVVLSLNPGEVPGYIEERI